jgi:hypothetical protein
MPVDVPQDDRNTAADTSKPDDSRAAIAARSARAIALLNYAHALEEYLDEQMPRPGARPQAGEPLQSLAGYLVALDALGPVTALLTAIGSGRPIDVTEFKTVLGEAQAAFLSSGLIGRYTIGVTPLEGSIQGSNSTERGWSVPGWCIEKLCQGMEELFSDVAEGDAAKHRS